MKEVTEAGGDRGTLISGVWWHWEGVRGTPQQGEGLMLRDGVRGSGEEAGYFYVLCGNNHVGDDRRWDKRDELSPALRLWGLYKAREKIGGEGRVL